MGLFDHRSMAGSSVSNQQNMIMLHATATEVSQQDAPLKVRPTQLVLLRTDLCISGNELARDRMSMCLAGGTSRYVLMGTTAIVFIGALSINVRPVFPWLQSGSV